LELRGDLSKVLEDLNVFPGATVEDGRVVLPLESDTKDRFLRRILPRIGIVRNLWSVVITRQGRVEFGAVDGLDEGQVWVGPAVGESVLRTLRDRRVIWEYAPGDKISGTPPW
ncbi:MAG: hypothetical protein HYX51_03355, partial [Chloroflexi bacterium]|nr:hypothetical protein [Chloroflexota bacterium]